MLNDVGILALFLFLFLFLFSFREMGSKGRSQGKKVNRGRVGRKMMMGTQVVVQGRDVF